MVKMAKIPIEFIRVFILLAIGLVTALWIHVNYDYGAGMTFALIGIVTVVIYKYAHDIFNGGK